MCKRNEQVKFANANNRACVDMNAKLFCVFLFVWIQVSMSSLPRNEKCFTFSVWFNDMFNSILNHNILSLVKYPLIDKLSNIRYTFFNIKILVLGKIWMRNGRWLSSTTLTTQLSGNPSAIEVFFLSFLWFSAMP